MSRPIPVEIIPSHIHLSHEDHEALFGKGHAATITHTLSQHGQYAYEERLTVVGKNKKSITLRVLGPERKSTQVEVTESEAALLGIKAPVRRSGDLKGAASCKLEGPKGSITVKAAIIPKIHLHLGDADAKHLQIKNGQEVRMEILGERLFEITHVTVRVHPTYKPRLHVDADFAREHWLTGVLHARIRETHR